MRQSRRQTCLSSTRPIPERDITLGIRIETRPGRFGPKEYIAGTDVRVETVAKLISRGRCEDEIVAAHPSLFYADVAAVAQLLVGVPA